MIQSSLNLGDLLPAGKKVPEIHRIQTRSELQKEVSHPEWETAKNWRLSLWSRPFTPQSLLDIWQFLPGADLIAGIQGEGARGPGVPLMCR
jgi:hypothetical protein